MSQSVTVSLSDPQSTIFLSPARFKVVVAGRRFGKSFVGVMLMLQAALGTPHQFVIAISPTYDQLTRGQDGIFVQLCRYAPKNKIDRITKSSGNLQITFKNGSIIQCFSGDKPDNLRAGGAHFVLMDEYADMDADLWPLVIRDKLADSGGGALFIGTPKGYNHFFDLWEDAHKREGWAAWQFTTEDGGRLTLEELALLKSEKSVEQFNQENLAKFTQLSDRVYSAFSDANYLDVTNDGVSPIHTGWDFNKVPGISIEVAQKRGPSDRSISVIESYTYDRGRKMTEEAAAELRSKYPNQHIICYPDPANGQENTTGNTDWDILRNAGFDVRGATYHVPIADRVNNVQANLCSADGKHRLFVNRDTCAPLIKTFNGLTYDDNGKPNKGSGLDHHSDALGYLLWGANNLMQGDVETTEWSPF